MRKTIKLVVAIATVVISTCGCSNKNIRQYEPVIAESTEETPEPEESEESLEPTPSPTVEPEESISEESSESEEVEPEESEPELGYEIIPIDEVTMYCVSNTANIRAGAGTQYDTVGSLSYGQEVTINGRVEDTESNKLWYVIKSSDDYVQMVSGSLLSTTKPQQQSTGNNNGNTNNTSNNGNTGNNQQQQQPVVQETEEPTERPDNAGQDWMDSMFGSDYGHDMIGAGGDTGDMSWADGINWQ